MVALLRQIKPEIAIIAGIIASAGILIAVIAVSLPVVDVLHSLVNKTGMDGEYGVIMLKALGICFITQLGADVCRDAGESSLASKIELGGRMSILALCIPMITKVAGLITQLME